MYICTGDALGQAQPTKVRLRVIRAPFRTFDQPHRKGMLKNTLFDACATPEAPHTC
jgi:hypothetical protein